jgi:hypothetical protein
MGIFYTLFALVAAIVNAIVAVHSGNWHSFFGWVSAACLGVPALIDFCLARR